MNRSADPQPGLFVCLEGGEGGGKSTQARLLAEALRRDGREVLLTFEPGATPVGAHLRRLVLDPETGVLSPRTESLIYAADKAEHVDSVVLPALRRGAVVITDRYVDSTLAYQGAGRALDGDDLAGLERVARWATRDLRPHLTVLLDLPAADGLARLQGRDRIEAESQEFHERVRSAFLALADADPERYLVLDARAAADRIAAQVLARVEALLAEAAS